VPLPVARHLFEVGHRVFKIVRTRPDKAHLAPQDVDDLRQLVQTRAADHAAQPGDPQMFDRVKGSARDRVARDHATELEGAERHAILAHAALDVEERAPVEKRIQDQQDGTDQQHQRKQDGPDHDVQATLDGRVEAALQRWRNAVSLGRNGNRLFRPIKHSGHPLKRMQLRKNCRTRF